MDEISTADCKRVLRNSKINEAPFYHLDKGEGDRKVQEESEYFYTTSPSRKPVYSTQITFHNERDVPNNPNLSLSLTSHSSSTPPISHMSYSKKLKYMDDETFDKISPPPNPSSVTSSCVSGGVRDLMKMSKEEERPRTAPDLQSPDKKKSCRQDLTKYTPGILKFNCQ